MRHCYVLRVFTRGDAGGNFLGVIPDMTGLPERAMQEIAAELGFSETVFIDWRKEGIPSVRIFSPTRELPFAGHPLVGAAWVLGMIGPGTVDRMTCQVGEIPFWKDGDEIWVDTPMATDIRATPEAEAVAVAAGLPEAVHAWWVQMPLPYLVVDVGSPEAVASATPDLGTLVAQGAGMCYVFAGENGEITARFFAPGAGVAEDPATGSAAAALAAIRHHRGEASGRLTISQGDAIGHPSTIKVSWDGPVVGLGGTVRRDEVRVLEQ
jgi:trans-2,3-dihydro-3-hydroxyanthranilate isomerase